MLRGSIGRLRTGSWQACKKQISWNITRRADIFSALDSYNSQPLCMARLQDVAATVLRNLADEAGATAFVAVLNKDEVVTIAVVEPAGTTVRVACRIGQRHAATIGADGMAILAGRAAVEGERLEITQGRRFGYLVSVSEIQLGAWGLASPILQHNRECEASVGVIALRPMDELTVSRLVLIAAKELGLRAFERA